MDAEWTRIAGSTVVASARYDDAARRIFLRLHDGSVLGFEDCSEAEWDQFMSPMASKGEHLDRILSGKAEVGRHLGTSARGMRTSVPRSSVLNAFQPAHEAVDPKRFAGRRAEVLALADALQTNGSVPIIFGDRGLGKSSLAVQGQLIAMGSSELLHQLGAESYAIPSDHAFITMFFSCSDGVRDTDELLQRLLLRVRELTLEGNPTDGFQLVDTSRKTSVSLKVFSHEVTRNYTRAPGVGDGDPVSTEDALLRACEALTNTFGGPFLIIIDELDRVADKRGLASIIKRLSTANMKFVLVGISQDWAELMLDHASLERQAVPIRVARMSPPELAEIVDLGEAHLQTAGVELRFHRAVRKRLVDISGGFPWFVHVVGQASVMLAFDEGSATVGESHAIIGVRDLVTNQFAQHFADLHQRAVRDSIQRETTLRAFAEFPNQDVPTSVVYPILRRLGVTNPSIYLGHLCSPAYGEPLLRPAYQDRGLVRFRNAMFRQYLLLAPSLYADVDQRVSESMTGIQR